MPLTTRQKTLIRSLDSRKGVRKSGMCLCEGARACSELISSAPELIELGVVMEGAEIPAEFAGLAFEPLPAREFDAISATVNSQGVMVVARVPEVLESNPNDRFMLVLDRVSDPGNMGSILRSARAAGLKTVFITSGSTDPFGCKAIRSGIAAQFALDIRRAESLADAVIESRAFGYDGAVWRAEPRGGDSLFDAEGLFENSILAIGGETSGVAEIPGAKAVSIPMPGGFESLNAAQAATVILFESVRRHIGDA